MSYSIEKYGRELTPEERKAKALENVASWWGQWQWYELRRPVIDDQRTLDENYNRYIGAKVILNFAFDMTDAEIETYCKEHVAWLLDDHALDVDVGPLHITPWTQNEEADHAD